MQNDLMRKQMEQIGFPTPQPRESYKPQYLDGLLRGISVFLVAIVTRVLGFNFAVSVGIWAAIYSIVVITSYVRKIPKKGSLSAEFQLTPRYFVAFFVIFMIVDNGILTFSK